MELVYLDGKKEPYTLSSIVAECAEVQHHTIRRTIRKNLERFERFGRGWAKTKILAFRLKFEQFEQSKIA